MVCTLIDLLIYFTSVSTENQQNWIKEICANVFGPALLLLLCKTAFVVFFISFLGNFLNTTFR